VEAKELVEEEARSVGVAFLEGHLVEPPPGTLSIDPLVGLRAETVEAGARAVHAPRVQVDPSEVAVLGGVAREGWVLGREEVENTGRADRIAGSPEGDPDRSSSRKTGSQIEGREAADE
jgi:hypothetical protein